MKRIVLECQGRLANVILCWANARHILNEVGLTTDRTLVISYSIPENYVSFPGTIVKDQYRISGLKKIKRREIARNLDDCLWIWEDLYSDFPPSDALGEIIRTIQVSDQFDAELKATISEPTLGVHVRHGDYEKWDGERARPAFPRASNEFYLEQIAVHWRFKRIFLASDGEEQDLEFISKLPNVVIRGKRDNPLFDLFALSRCNGIIGSNSTFSSVASYLGHTLLVTP